MTPAEELLPAVYDDLRRLAAGRLAKAPAGESIQATALVHEAYVRLTGNAGGASWRHRGHFFMAAAEAMRRILVERARQKRSLKRGADARRHEIQEGDLVSPVEEGQLLDLDEALGRLAADSPNEAELVKLRYFAGLTLEEAAEVIGVSRATAVRYWAYARAFLQRELAGTRDD